jgi:hypothetical protein
MFILKKYLIILFDIILSPFTLIAAVWFKIIRKHIITNVGTISKVSKNILFLIGVFPIIDHYYEPLFGKVKHRSKSIIDLSYLNFNIDEQILFLRNFTFNNEIIELSLLSKDILNFSFKNTSFLSGDADVLYNIVRFLKPKKIIEIGCGQTSLLIQIAININKKNNKKYYCNHICIEPYEAEFLTQLDLLFLKKPVQEIDLHLFESLHENDILFIDSSHIIRPDGDVLFEILKILPKLRKGVYIHFHDIFTPNNYLDQWVNNGVNFWNEQYLLEAFLTCNNDFKVICAVNYIKNNYYIDLKNVCPMLTIDREPGSFWIKKIN